jgi:hypothetical protein
LALSADALVPCFFALHLDCFIVKQNFAAIYRDWCRLDNFIVTRNFSAIYRDWQKTSHRDADGT